MTDSLQVAATIFQILVIFNHKDLWNKGLFVISYYKINKINFQSYKKQSEVLTLCKDDVTEFQIKSQITITLMIVLYTINKIIIKFQVFFYQNVLETL